MIDFHAHFLPGMDDGSQSAEESRQMLELSYDMCVDTLVATPHYFADFESIDSFINRRREKLGQLAAFLGETVRLPEIYEGAEVAFYPGMYGDGGLSRLCIGNSKYLLIEMPYCEWSSLTERELLNLINRGITPIIAHIDRYLADQRYSGKIETLLNLGVAAQINGESLIDPAQRKRALKFIKEMGSVLLGSDCHNMNDRSPNLDKALHMIEKNIGSAYIDRIMRFGRDILKQ